MMMDISKVIAMILVMLMKMLVGLKFRWEEEELSTEKVLQLKQYW